MGVLNVKTFQLISPSKVPHFGMLTELSLLVIRGSQHVYQSSYGCSSCVLPSWVGSMNSGSWQLRHVIGRLCVSRHNREMNAYLVLSRMALPWAQCVVHTAAFDSRAKDPDITEFIFRTQPRLRNRISAARCRLSGSTLIPYNRATFSFRRSLYCHPHCLWWTHGHRCQPKWPDLRRNLRRSRRHGRRHNRWHQTRHHPAQEHEASAFALLRLVVAATRSGSSAMPASAERPAPGASRSRSLTAA